MVKIFLSQNQAEKHLGCMQTHSDQHTLCGASVLMMRTNSKPHAKSSRNKLHVRPIWNLHVAIYWWNKGIRMSLINLCLTMQFEAQLYLDLLSQYLCFLNIGLLLGGLKHIKGRDATDVVLRQSFLYIYFHNIFAFEHQIVVRWI